jgi:hypothetical protein
MASTSETGIAVNIANLGRIKSAATSFGTDYDPANPDITIEAMEIIITNSNSAITALSTILGPFTNARNTRKLFDDGTDKYATRIKNAMFSSKGATAKDKSQIETILRKLRGARAKAIPATVAPEDPIHISVSQQGFDNRVETFRTLMEFVAGNPRFNTNTVAVKLPAITTYYNTLKANNTAVIDLTPGITNARTLRNTILYAITTGLVDIAYTAKDYIYEVFGARTPQAKMVSKLRFTRPKKAVAP